MSGTRTVNATTFFSTVAQPPADKGSRPNPIRAWFLPIVRPSITFAASGRISSSRHTPISLTCKANARVRWPVTSRRSSILGRYRDSTRKVSSISMLNWCGSSPRYPHSQRPRISALDRVHMQQVFDCQPHQVLHTPVRLFRVPVQNGFIYGHVRRDRITAKDIVGDFVAV